MSELPPGFVLEDQASAAPPPPDGFVVQGQPSPAAKPFGLGDTWPAQLAKSIYGAVTLPGDVYQGNAVVPQSANMPGGEDTSSIGRVTDLAGLISPTAPKAATSLAPAAGLPTAEELKAAASSGYDAARGLGVDLKSSSVANTAQTLAAKLENDGINAKLAPKTFGIISELSAPPSGSTVSIANLETARRALGHAAQDFLNPTEKMAASRAIEHLDDYLANIPQADVLAGDAANASKILGEARANYAASKRSDQITGQVEIADRNAAAANSGQNIGNSVRQRFNALLKSDKKVSGYTDAERAQMERAVRGTVPGNIARTAGNMLGGGGGLGSVASAAVGAGSLGPVGALAPAVGYGLKKFSDASVARQVRKLDEMTRMRAPLSQGAEMTGLSKAEQFKRAAAMRALLLSQSRGGQ